MIMSSLPDNRPSATIAPDLHVVIDNRARVVTVAGELDLATADRLVDCTAELIATAGDVVLDLGGVPFVCAAGIGAIVRMSNALRTHGSRLVLVDVAPAVRRTLQHGRVEGLLAAA